MFVSAPHPLFRHCAFKKFQLLFPEVHLFPIFSSHCSSLLRIQLYDISVAFRTSFSAVRKLPFTVILIDRKTLFVVSNSLTLTHNHLPAETRRLARPLIPELK